MSLILMRFTNLSFIMLVKGSSSDYLKPLTPLVVAFSVGDGSMAFACLSGIMKYLLTRLVLLPSKLGSEVLLTIDRLPNQPFHPG